MLLKVDHTSFSLTIYYLSLPGQSAVIHICVAASLDGEAALGAECRAFLEDHLLAPVLVLDLLDGRRVDVVLDQGRKQDVENKSLKTENINFFCFNLFLSKNAKNYLLVEQI